MAIRKAARLKLAIALQLKTAPRETLVPFFFGAEEFVWVMFSNYVVDSLAGRRVSTCFSLSDAELNCHE
jgi:hypothetical protein